MVESTREMDKIERETLHIVVWCKNSDAADGDENSTG